MKKVLSVTSHINCIVEHGLINVYLMAYALKNLSGHDDIAIFQMTSLMTLIQHKNRKLHHNSYFDE